MERDDKEKIVSRDLHFPSAVRSVLSLTNRDLKKWYKSPIVLAMSLITPVVWLVLFGKAFNIGSLFSGAAGNQVLLSVFGTTSYFSFLAVGMLSFMALTASMQSGMSMVWDRRFGFTNKLLSTPVKRSAIIIGKVLNSVIRALVQSAVVLIIAIVLGMTTGFITVSNLLVTFSALFLLSFGISALFLMLALKATDWQSQMMIINLLMMPLFFTSNAFFPISEMPSWLQVVANFNPMSYAIDISRGALLGVTTATNIGLDFVYLGGFAVVFGVVCIVLAWKLLKG